MASFYAEKRSAVGDSADLTAVEKVATCHTYIHTIKYIYIHTCIHTFPKVFADIIARKSEIGPNDVTGYNSIEEVLYVCKYVRDILCN